MHCFIPTDTITNVPLLYMHVGVSRCLITMLPLQPFHANLNQLRREDVIGNDMGLGNLLARREDAHGTKTYNNETSRTVFCVANYSYILEQLP